MDQLFSQLCGPTSARSTPGPSFNPCCHGSALQPLCSGRTRLSPLLLVSILVVMDQLFSPHTTTAGRHGPAVVALPWWGRPVPFQSLLSWISSSASSAAPLPTRQPRGRPGPVSILVVMDQLFSRHRPPRLSGPAHRRVSILVVMDQLFSPP